MLWVTTKWSDELELRKLEQIIQRHSLLLLTSKALSMIKHELNYIYFFQQVLLLN